MSIKQEENKTRDAMVIYTIEEQIDYQNELKQQNLTEINSLQTTVIGYQQAIGALVPQEQFYQDSINQCNTKINELTAGNEMIDATINNLESM